MWKRGYSGPVVRPFGRSGSRAWTSPTDSGKCWSLLSRIRLEEKTDGAETLARLSRCPQRHTTLDTSHRRSLEGPSPTLPALPETSHRRFQRWIEEEVLSSILKTLAEDLQEE